MVVLIAEDEALVALTLALELEASGHRVVGPAATLEQAESLALQERPDLALVDIDLRRRGDGVSLARELQDRWQVPSLFMTGRPEAARDAADAALGVICKPYDLEDIQDSLVVAESIITGGSPRAPLPPALELFSRSCSVAAPAS